MKIHFAAATGVLAFALFLDVSMLEFLFLFLAITLVVMAELFNTALEKAVDLAMPDYHPMAKIAKDAAAAAVLMAAIFAAIVGVFIFYEPIRAWFEFGFEQMTLSLPKLAAWIGLVTVTLSLLHAIFYKDPVQSRPSILAALAFSMSCLIALLSKEMITSLLALFLAIMICLILYEKTNRSLKSLFWGALIGSGATFGYYFVLSQL